MTAKELRAQRAQLVAQSRALLETAENANRDFAAAEQAQWEKMNADIDALGAKIARVEKLEALEAENKRILDAAGDLGRVAGSAVAGTPETDDSSGEKPIPAEEARALALQAWFLNDSREPGARDLITDRHRQAARETGIAANASELRIPLAGRGMGTNFYGRMRAGFRMGWNAALGGYHNASALTTQSGAGGGVLVPEGFVTAFETALLAYGYMMQVAEVMRTATAAPLPWPTANDTGNKGRRLNQAAAADSTGTTVALPTFGAHIWYAYKYTSEAILVPYELLRDNAVGLEAWIGDALGIRLGRVFNDDFTNGTGNDQPTGILTGAVAGKTAASANAIKIDEVIDLEHAIDPAYRNQPGVGYMCHDAVIQYLRKLKDGEGRYLWQQSANSGEPDRLNNRPLTRNQSMPNAVSTGNKTLLFGLLSKYKVRQVGDIRLYRLTERFRMNDQDGFLAFAEADGGILDAGTHPIKYLVQP